MSGKDAFGLKMLLPIVYRVRTFADWRVKDQSLLCPVQVLSTFTSLSTSSRVLPACKQMRTRSCPFSTVGQTMGRTMNPACWM